MVDTLLVGLVLLLLEGTLMMKRMRTGGGDGVGGGCGGRTMEEKFEE